MNVHEEELEQRLRTLFADERLDLPPPADVVKTIVAGARRRRRRRRSMLTATGVVAAVVVVSGGLTVFKLNAEDNTAAMTAGSTGLGTKSPEPPAQGMQPSGSAPGQTSTGHIEVPPSHTGQPATSKNQGTTSTKPPPARVYSGPLLAADGFGSLKLGMSESEVTAHGVTLKDAKPAGNCTFYAAQGGGVPASANVAISASSGLVIVSPAVVPHTVEGIGAGSTKDQVRAVYPGAYEEAGAMIAPALGASEYHFLFGGSGVNAASLYNGNQDCAG